MSKAPVTRWHASPHRFDRPHLDQRTQNKGTHANSGLGIFTATEPAEYLWGFGGFLYELELIEGLRHLRVTIDQLRILGSQDHDWNWFNQERQRLSVHHDVIDLVECSGSVKQTIILRDDAIAFCRLIGEKSTDNSSPAAS